MEQNPRPKTVLETCGEEIIRIVTPVSICMLLVVILVSILNGDSSNDAVSFASMATMAYAENSSDSMWDKLKGALLNSLVFVAVVTVVTFLLVLLFYLRCTKFLKYYMGFSSFLVLGFLGGEIALFLISNFSFPIDCVTFAIVLYNFTVVGVLAVFMSKMAIFLTQAYLVVIGLLVAYWFTLLPEWTTWVLLVAMALYDLAAVLLPGGPLRLLVELAMSRDEDIPALVYEARPVLDESSERSGLVRRRVWRDDDLRANLVQDSSENERNILEAEEGRGRVFGGDSELNSPLIQRINNPSENQRLSLRANLVQDSSENERNILEAEEGRGRVLGGDSEVNSPVIQRINNPSENQRLSLRVNERNILEGEGGRGRVLRDDSELNSPLIRQTNSPSENLALEGIGLGASGAIKLGLGDFIFYSVLVGRAAMYDFMTVYACYLAIIAGLGLTLILLAFYRKALPALPFSIMLGVVFYLLTRFLLEAFVVECSMSLLMF